jgi:hypothetical protein
MVLILYLVLLHLQVVDLVLVLVALLVVTAVLAEADLEAAVVGRLEVLVIRQVQAHLKAITGVLVALARTMEAEAEVRVQLAFWADLIPTLQQDRAAMVPLIRLQAQQQVNYLVACII